MHTRRTLHLMLLAIITFFSASHILSQSTNLDSLYSIWKDQGESDSIRVEAYKMYIWKGYMYTDPDSAYILAEELHHFASDREFLFAKAKAYNLQGVAKNVQQEYDSALELFDRNGCVIVQNIFCNDQLAYKLDKNGRYDIWPCYQIVNNTVYNGEPALFKFWIPEIDGSISRSDLVF